MEIPNFSKLPKGNWFSYYCNLGYQFFDKKVNTQGKLNIVINVPVNYDVSLAIAIGFAHAVYTSRKVNNISPVNWIKNIEPGTLVFYSTYPEFKEKSYIFKGISDSGLPMLEGIGVNKNLKTTLLKKETWQNIRIAPVQDNYKRERTLSNDKAMEKIYEKYKNESLRSLFNLGKPSFSFIGNENKISEAIKRDLEEGFTIQDYLRIKKFGDKQYPFISDFYSGKGDGIDSSFKGEQPVIIEGAYNFLKYQEFLSENPKIIIFSRESPLDISLEALEKIENLLFKKNISSDQKFIEILSSTPMPSNFELFCWREKNE